MRRPLVSVVMPFAGSAEQADQAMRTLLSIERQAGDELILADNSGIASPVEGVDVVPVGGERSPSHARNVGAERARRDWILFIDSDCVAPADLLDGYFAQPVAEDVGALAGEVRAGRNEDTLAARYTRARSFLSQEQHLAHPYLPRAVAANLMVRRQAFTEVGGFHEGLRAAEDTDFSWRLSRAGWRIELRREAAVEHHYRTSVHELRGQWRGYAAGRAWLGRRYDGFTPEPGLLRALRRARGGREQTRGVQGLDRVSRGPEVVDKARFLLLDLLLGLEELAGLTLSNRPDEIRGAPQPARVVVLAERFPEPDDPMAESVRRIDAARVEAAMRPEAVDHQLTRAIHIDYREDDGLTSRVGALMALMIRHPLRCMADLRRRERRGALKPPARRGPTLLALAPAVRRLQRDRDAAVHAIGGEDTDLVAERLARLAGREHQRELAGRRADPDTANPPPQASG